MQTFDNSIGLITVRHAKRVLLTAAILFCGPVLNGAAVADQLAKEACDALKAEFATLDASGLKDEMEKGPDWAKANMAPDRLKQVARYIELEEQISFRCRVLTVPPRKKPLPAAKDAGKDQPGKDAKAAADPTAVPAAKPGAPVAKPKPAVKPAERNPAQTTTPAAKVQKPQAKTGLFEIE